MHRTVFLVLIFQTMTLVKGKHRCNANIVASLEDNGLRTKQNGKLAGYTHFYSAGFVELYHTDSQ